MLRTFTLFPHLHKLKMADNNTTAPTPSRFSCSNAPCHVTWTDVLFLICIPFRLHSPLHPSYSLYVLLFLPLYFLLLSFSPTTNTTTTTTTTPCLYLDNIFVITLRFICSTFPYPFVYTVQQKTWMKMWILESCSKPTCIRRSKLPYLQMDTRKPNAVNSTFSIACTVPHYEHRWAFSDISVLPTAWFTLISVTLCIKEWWNISLKVNVRWFVSYFNYYHRQINHFQREIKSYKFFQSSS
jgi:hypothetical protein